MNLFVANSELDIDTCENSDSQVENFNIRSEYAEHESSGSYKSSDDCYGPTSVSVRQRTAHRTWDMNQYYLNKKHFCSALFDNTAKFGIYKQRNKNIEAIAYLYSAWLL